MQALFGRQYLRSVLLFDHYHHETFIAIVDLLSYASYYQVLAQAEGGRLVDDAISQEVRRGSGTSSGFRSSATAQSTRRSVLKLVSWLEANTTAYDARHSRAGSKRHRDAAGEGQGQEGAYVEEEDLSVLDFYLNNRMEIEFGNEGDDSYFNSVISPYLSNPCGTPLPQLGPYSNIIVEGRHIGVMPSPFSALAVLGSVDLGRGTGLITHIRAKAPAPCKEHRAATQSAITVSAATAGANEAPNAADASDTAQPKQEAARAKQRIHFDLDANEDRTNNAIEGMTEAEDGDGAEACKDEDSLKGTKNDEKIEKKDRTKKDKSDKEKERERENKQKDKVDKEKKKDKKDKKKEKGKE